MIRINFVKSALFLLLILSLICLLINEVQAWHCWHDSFYAHHDIQQPLIFDIASDTPLPIQNQPQQLANVASLASYWTAW